VRAKDALSSQIALTAENKKKSTKG
jgi:hypothetical protein